MQGAWEVGIEMAGICWVMLGLPLVKLVGTGWFVFAGECRVGWCELVVV